MQTLSIAQFHEIIGVAPRGSFFKVRRAEDALSLAEFAAENGINLRIIHADDYIWDTARDTCNGVITVVTGFGYTGVPDWVEKRAIEIKIAYTTLTII